MATYRCVRYVRCVRCVAFRFTQPGPLASPASAAPCTRPRRRCPPRSTQQQRGRPQSELPAPVGADWSTWEQSIRRNQPSERARDTRSGPVHQVASPRHRALVPPGRQPDHPVDTGRDGRIRARYGELTALPLADCCGGGGVYTGIAATWAKNELHKDSDAVAFIVELPGDVLNTQQVNAHADAVLTIGIEG